jgi:hypothetical protein
MSARRQAKDNSRIEDMNLARSLIRVNVELLRQLSKCTIALDRSE